MSSCSLPFRTFSLSSGNTVAVIGPARYDVPVARLVRAVMERFAPQLPADRTARILLKPNCNNDLPSVFGNSTDLRLIKAVIDFLHERGYRRLTIGDGPNIGTFRKGIDVLGRLGLRALAGHSGVEVVDLNRAPAVSVELATGPVAVAEICLTADCVISLPKIKTHAEAGFSFAMKNLIGCASGTDKRRVHDDLARNIAALNERIPVRLVIGDGLIVMEGNGPGDGQPRYGGLLLAGDDPFWLDGVAARLAGLDPRRVPYWQAAIARRNLTEADLLPIDAIAPLVELVPAPARGTAATLLDHPALAVLRDRTRAIHSSHLVRSLLYRLGVIQDVYSGCEPRITRLLVDSAKCQGCGLCAAFCPHSLGPAGLAARPDNCLRCLSCYWLCPHTSVTIDGELGYLAEHRRRFAGRLARLREQILAKENSE